MKIILLVGPPSTGKTTTLNDLYALLVKGLPNKPQITRIPDNKSRDFECVIPYQGKKVAIFSMGDKEYRNYEAIIKYCGIVDVLILAHSTDGSGKMRLPTSVATCPQHHLIPKTTDNAADCQSIISKI